MNSPFNQEDALRPEQEAPKPEVDQTIEKQYTRLFLFPNLSKKTEKHPDFVLMQPGAVKGSKMTTIGSAWENTSAKGTKMITISLNKTL